MPETLTIKQQYNSELDRIWDEITKFDYPNLARLFKNLNTPLNQKRELIIETFTAKSEDGNFLFEAGQKENPEYTDWNVYISERIPAPYMYIAHTGKKVTPKTLSDLFLSNCLLTGVDEVDENKINKLKRVKFVHWFKKSKGRFF